MCRMVRQEVRSARLAAGLARARPKYAGLLGETPFADGTVGSLRVTASRSPAPGSFSTAIHRRTLTRFRTSCADEWLTRLEVDALLVWGHAISLEVDALLVWGNANSSGETPTSAGPGQDIADTLLWACCQAGPSDGARCVDLTQPRCYFAPLSAVFVAAVLYASGRSASRAREGVSAIGRF